MTADPDRSSMATMKSIMALLGIETTVVVDAFGRTDFAIDRQGMERFRAAAVDLGIDELVVGIDRMIAGDDL